MRTVRTMTRSTITHRFVSAFALAAGLCSVACGGGAAASKGAATPGQEGNTAPPATSAESPAGGQFGIPDAPTSSEPSNRPKMNAAASAAYAAGMDAFKKGDLTGAKNQFTQATQADPKAYQAFYSLGVVRERTSETSGALSAYRQATTIVADYEPAIVAYAVLLAHTGKPDDATDFLNQRQAQMPKSAAVSAALAEVKSIQGNSGEAQRLAQEALKLNPDYRPAMVTLARDHYRSRRLDLALYALKGILDGYGEENPPRDKNNAEARLIRGLIYKEQGLRGPAIQELAKGARAASRSGGGARAIVLLLPGVRQRSGRATTARAGAEVRRGQPGRTPQLRRRVSPTRAPRGREA